MTAKAIQLQFTEWALQPRHFRARQFDYTRRLGRGPAASSGADAPTVAREFLQVSIARHFGPAVVIFTLTSVLSDVLLATQ